MSTIRKKRMFELYTACILFLCLSATMFLYKVSSANATDVLAEGISGTCAWRYERVNDEVIFTLCPKRGREGILEDWISNSYSGSLKEWDYLPSWHNRYREQATRVIVRGRVKPRTCQNMFLKFRNAKSFDLRGLDITGVSNMRYMFYGCSSLPSLNLNGWNVSCVTDMDGMFCWNSDLTSLNLNGWDVSRVTTMNYMFCGCSRLTSLNVNTWNVSRVMQMLRMFHKCSSLTSLDMSGWNVSRVTCMNNMFSECSSLTALDLRDWDMSAVSNMAGMFEQTPSLKRICVGQKFYIHDGAAFDQAGSGVGTCWVQVSFINGGTRENPRGKVFTSGNDLLAFHANRKDGENGVEEYVRIVSGPTTIVFDKGLPEACGTMCSQTFAYNEEKTLAQNNYQLCNYHFCGWRDPEGNFYQDGQIFTNTCPVCFVPKVLTAQWVKNDESGSSATDSHARTHTIRFDVNVSPQENVSSAALSELTVGDGESVTIPSNYQPVRSGHTFLGWNTRADGRGGMYMSGASIDNVREDITLYARWKEDNKVKIKYVVHNNRGGRVSCAGEDVSDYDGTPKGCVALPDKGYVFEKWACTVSGYTWYCAEPKLKKEQLDLFAKRNSYYVPTTFVAYFKSKAHEVSSRAADDVLPTKPDEKPALPCELPANGGSAHVQEKPENKVKLSYEVDDPETGRLSRSTETFFDSTGNPRGCFAYPLNGEKSTFVEWRCDTDAEWRYDRALLEQEEIEKVAKKDGTYAPTTFRAHFKHRKHTIKFDTTSYVLTVEHGESVEIPLTYVPDTRLNKFFDGWDTRKDGKGARYLQGGMIHTVVGSMTLYPQWTENTVTLTYTVDDPDKGKVSQESEIVSGNRRTPHGSFAHARDDKRYVFTKWVCDVDPKWSSKKDSLSQDDIDKVAKKDGVYVPVTFTACFEFKKYTVAFDTTTYTLTTEYGQSVQIPKTYEPIKQTGKDFIGWNTKKDGSGKNYKPGDTIPNITQDTTLYPQWQDIKVILTYKVDDSEKGSVWPKSQTIFATGKDPSGSIAYASNKEKYVFDKWTCDIDPGWSYNREQLEPEEIAKVAKRDGLYVAVTFTAHFKKAQGVTARRR